MGLPQQNWSSQKKLSKPFCTSRILVYTIKLPLASINNIIPLLFTLLKGTGEQLFSAVLAMLFLSASILISRRTKNLFTLGDDYLSIRFLCPISGNLFHICLNTAVYFTGIMHIYLEMTMGGPGNYNEIHHHHECRHISSLSQNPMPVGCSTLNVFMHNNLCLD